MNVKKLQPRNIRVPVKVLWISNSPHLPTGYAKVTREICSRLGQHKELFDVGIVGMQHYSFPQKEKHYQVFGVRKDHVKEDIEMHIRTFNADIVVILEDTFTMTNNSFYSLKLNGAKLVLYVPMDGMNIPTGGSLTLRNADKIISMSEYTKEVLDNEHFDSSVVWHGVDTKLFSPPTELMQTGLKRTYGFNEDDFVIFSFFRNSARKTPQTLIEGVCKALSKLPENVKFLMHTNEADSIDKNLYDFIERFMEPKYGKLINERVFITNKYVDDNELAEMMKLSDLVVSASSGEGFGLIMPEAMACKKLIIHSEYSTGNELIDKEQYGIGKRGITIPPVYKIVSSYNVEHGHIDTDVFSDAIIDYVLSEDKTEYNKYIENGYQFVTNYLNWDAIAENFKKEILKVM